MNCSRALCACFMLLSLTSCSRSINRTIGLFGIDSSSLVYSIVEQDEYWFPNGDGHYYCRLSYEQSSTEGIVFFKNQMMSNGAKPLPINNPSLLLGHLQSYEITTNEGLYILQILDSRTGDFSALVLDETNKEIIVLISIT